MKSIARLVLAVCCCLSTADALSATKHWKGTAGDSLWASATNWENNTVPTATDTVVLDNTLLSANYVVFLPSGNTSISIKKIIITPTLGDTISLVLPSTNTNNSGLVVGDGGTTDPYDVILSPGAILKNASGAAGGNGIAFTAATDSMQILSGGRYVHSTLRANGSIQNQTSKAAGTETGIFEFDVPTNSVYSPSLSGRTYGTLMFSATANGGTRLYGGSGSNPLNIRGNYVINPGVKDSSTQTGAMNISGNYINNGILNPQAQTVNFVGSSPQALGGTGATILNAITVNNTAGVSLTGSVTVSGTTTFTAGNLILNTNSYTANGTISGATAGRAFVTNGTGGIVRQIATGGIFVFPLSTDGTDYNPATVLMGPTDATDTFTLRVAPGIVPSAPYDGAAVQRTWTITKGTPTANNVTLTFQWSGSQEGATFSRATADVWRYNGSSWVSVGTASSSGSDPYTLTVSGITAFSPFIVGNHGELPITLGAFTGSVRTSGGVSLQWSTVSEINNYGFYVERAAAAAGDFVTISPLIPGHGTTNVQQHYGFVDHSPAPGSTWYRLKQVDLDQTVHMSDAILVQGSPVPVEQAPRVFELAQNYPNPFNPSTDIRFTVEKQGHASLKVYNSIGQEVAVLFDDNADAGRYYRVTLDGSKLASGVYFYRLDSNGKAHVRSLVLLK